MVVGNCSYEDQFSLCPSGHKPQVRNTILLVIRRESIKGPQIRRAKCRSRVVRPRWNLREVTCANPAVEQFAHNAVRELSMNANFCLIFSMRNHEDAVRSPVQFTLLKRYRIWHFVFDLNNCRRFRQGSPRPDELQSDIEH